MKHRFMRAFRRADEAQKAGRLLLLCAIVGVLAGIAGVLFEYLVNTTKSQLVDGWAGFQSGLPGSGASDIPYQPLILLFLLVAGGLVGGILVYALAPETEGAGTDHAISAYHLRLGIIRGRVSIIKTIASAITLGTGGSAGREGPIAQIGASLGSLMSRWLGLSVQERRILMVAGMAAGIGAVFRAPLASALFAAEVLYREMDMEFEALVPAVISSIVSFSVFTLVFGFHPLFNTPSTLRFSHPFELLPFSVLAVTVALGARVFVKTLERVRGFFKGLKLTVFLRPALGGLFAGVFAFVLPEALASGYGLVQAAIDGHVATGFLVAVVIGKMLTTAFTVGSGASGGVFGPSVVLGGLIGALVGQVFIKYVPGISPPVGAFVVVGMAGFFSAAANTPISTIIMVSEITGNYQLLVPSMWVSILAFMLVRHTTLYPSQAQSRAQSPVHFGEMMGDVLAHLTVQDALGDEEHEPLVTVNAGWSLTRIAELYTETNHSCFPVTDAQGLFAGVIDEKALRQAVATQGLADVVVAADLIERAPTLTPEESLHSAMHKMVQSTHDELVVVASKDHKKAIGTLSRRDLIAAYDHQIQRNLAEQNTETPIWDSLVNRLRRRGDLNDQ